jgi:hypothetical protein
MKLVFFSLYEDSGLTRAISLNQHCLIDILSTNYMLTLYSCRNWITNNFINQLMGSTLTQLTSPTLLFHT